MTKIVSYEELKIMNYNDFVENIDLLFEKQEDLTRLLYGKRENFNNYLGLIENTRETLLGSNDLELKKRIVNAHPRIGEQKVKLSILSYQEQRSSEDKPNDPIIEALAKLNEQYENKFGFKFIVFVNGRTKQEIIPVIEKRLLHTDTLSELNLGLSEMMDIAKSRLSKLTITHKL
ncbi:allantoinase [Tieghemostelium lacteum]|uniref:Allantoinase n=1 Tax=Tieghemostelium lacteum TaxID=361077 RepID=A0A152AAC5_TIELA|nr:allantoinase [Tieghemostelium lacteum]|eukprot:KYR03081.1 allantoinase [Tieghemostelium lacteum]